MFDPSVYTNEISAHTNPHKSFKSFLTDDEKLVSETSYRRGYYQGAHEVLRILGFLPLSIDDKYQVYPLKMGIWMKELYKWRNEKHNGILDTPQDYLAFGTPKKRKEGQKAKKEIVFTV